MQANASSITLAIEGMSCGHCVQAVTKALAAVPGVKPQSVAVGSARVELSSGAAAADAVGAVERAGYTAQITEQQPPPKPGCSCCDHR